MVERVVRKRPGNPAFHRGMASINPGGRPTALPGFREGCRNLILDKGGLQKLQAMAFNPRPANPEEYQDRRWAFGKILDYGFGKAVQAVVAADVTPRVNVIVAPSTRLDLQAREIES
jgi:hypothetical protein